MCASNADWRNAQLDNRFGATWQSKAKQSTLLLTVFAVRPTAIRELPTHGLSNGVPLGMSHLKQIKAKQSYTMCELK